jgi:transposase-like protein
MPCHSLLCVRSIADSLILRNLKKMWTERYIIQDYSTVHSWCLYLRPNLHRGFIAEESAKNH